jgi:ethanolamine ammonia-lyase large subunit
MGVPCSDDVMLNYQSTSYHDALAMRRLFNLRPAPEFLDWLQNAGIYDGEQPRALSAAARTQLMRGLEVSIEQSA